MFDRFTDRARKVMGYARQGAERLGHDHIGTEHLLLGVVGEGTGVAAHVLGNLGIDPDKVRSEVEKLFEKGSTEGPIQMPFAPDAHRALDYAEQEARKLRHKYVGTEHILLGLLRETDCAAARVLVSLGVGLKDVRREVMDLLGVEPEDCFSRAKTGTDKQLELGEGSSMGPSQFPKAEAAGTGTGDEADVARMLALDGVYPQLGMLPPETIISQKGLAKIFCKAPRSMQRWVEERWLPQPIQLGEDRCWLNEAIVNHLRKRHEKAERDRDRAERNVS